MINKNLFKQKLILFLENFDYKISKAYIEIIYKGFNDNFLTMEDFDKAFQKMMYKKKAELYGRPALGDWIECCNKTEWVYDLQFYQHEAKDKVKCLESIQRRNIELFNVITKTKQIEEGKNNE